MSRIDDLIAELCPAGVPAEPLAAIGKWYGGGTPSKTKSEFWEEGTIPWVSPKDMGARVVDDAIDSITESAIRESSTRLVPPTSVVMVVRSSILDRVFPTALVPIPVALNQDMKAVVPRDGVIPEYIAHILSSRGSEILRTCRKSGGSVTSINSPQLFAFRIPVPPLEVQREIVRVLDQFTQLEAELEAELEARRRQYEHYSTMLLDSDFFNACPEVRIGDICKVNRGIVISKDYLADHPGGYPVYSSQTANQGVFGFIDTFAFDDDESITWTTDGANAGSVFYHKKKKFTITNVCGRLIVSDPGVLTRYLFFQLRYRAKSYVNEGMGNPKLMANHMSAVKVPIPLIDDQHRIVKYLDEFDALVNDLSIGLPAELAARRKQYEYYRDKLLTFEEATA